MVPPEEPLLGYIASGLTPTPIGSLPPRYEPTGKKQVTGEVSPEVIKEIKRLCVEREMTQSEVIGFLLELSIPLAKKESV